MKMLKMNKQSEDLQNVCANSRAKKAFRMLGGLKEGKGDCAAMAEKYKEEWGKHNDG